MPQTRTGYTRVAIVLHWLIAAAIIFQIILGWRMEGPSTPTTYAVFQLHKSIGVTILVLSLARLAWRLFNRPPPLPAGRPRWEVIAAGAVHWGFYAVMIGLPLTGWLAISTARVEIPTVLYGALPWPHLPFLADLAPAAKRQWHLAGEIGHHLLVFVTYLLLVLHVGAALKHQFIDKDKVVAGMLPGVRPGSWLEPRLWLTALATALVVAAAYAYGPSPAPTAAPLAPAAPPAPTTKVQIPAPIPAVPAVQAPTEILAPPSVKPSSWRVAKGGALTFTAQWSGQPIEGRFKAWSADILFDPAALADSRIKVVVDVTSADTADAQRDFGLRGQDWFDAVAHPQAVFTSERIRSLGGDRYEARGQLDLRGGRRPVTVPFTVAISGDRARAQGALTLDRTDFGVGQGEWAATDQIAAKVSVRFNFNATRKPAV